MKGTSLNIRDLHLRDVNWFALAGGALTILLAAASLYVPWWQLTVGQTLAKISFSPVNLSTTAMGYSIAVPIIMAVGWMFMLMLLSAGIVLAVYSIMPLMPYSRLLLSFAYKKPLATIIAFLVFLLLVTNSGAIISMIIGSSRMSGADLSLPWSGAKTLQLPSSMTQGTIQGVNVSTELGWTFWLAITVAGLCIAARIYHVRLERSQSKQK
jgi:hypothetical protein